MPGAVSRIEGMREAREALQHLGKAVQNRVGKRALRAAAETFARAVKVKAPVSSRPGNRTAGSLKASVKAAPGRQSKGRPTAVVIAEDIASVPNEYGTSKMAAQPFFRPAVDATRNAAAHDFAAALKAEVDAEIAKIAKG